MDLDVAMTMPIEVDGRAAARTARIVVANAPDDARAVEFLERFTEREATTSFRVSQIAKRSIDVTASLAALVVLAPVLLALALAVRLSSPGPVLFRQVRMGRGGRDINVLKFRSMRTDAESRLRAAGDLHEEYLANGFTLHLHRDPRVTPLGRVLRRTSLDELPQLWNVLRGDMSLVGPRPVLPEELAMYGDVAWAYQAVRPGVTGLWQVSGRNSVPYPERVLMDAEYVSRLGVLRDVVIMLKTPLAMAKGSTPTLKD